MREFCTQLALLRKVCYNAKSDVIDDAMAALPDNSISLKLIFKERIRLFLMITYYMVNYFIMPITILK